METTGTFKYRKIDLVRDGFDPAKIEQPVYFEQPGEAHYIQLTPELYRRIQGGEFRL
jgi:fatty-acyl-CoA synthase